MKILLLAFDLGTLGGIGSFNYELAMSLSRIGVETLVITRSEPLNGVKPPHDIKFYTFFSPAIPPKDVTFYLLNMRWITRIVKSEKPDVIHDSSASIGLMPWLSRLAPVVSTVHGSPSLGYLRATGGCLNDHLRAVLFEVTHRVLYYALAMLCKADVEGLFLYQKAVLPMLLLMYHLSLRESYGRFHESCIAESP